MIIAPNGLAGDRIRGLVCGLPSHRRAKRLLMALQAFMDGSGNQDQGVLVLAGYVSTMENWAEFSDQWNRILNMTPRLRYLKMNDAVRLKQEFHGWSEERRDERLGLFREVIENYVQLAIASTVLYADLHCAMQTIGMQLKIRPFHVAAFTMMRQLQKYQCEYGLNEKIDFYFDNEVMEMSLILENWSWLVSTASDDLKPWIGATPQFQDDQDFPPLQAADMIAWLGRNQWESLYQGKPRYEANWPVRKQIPLLSVAHNRDSLTALLQEAYFSASSSLLGGASAEQDDE